jgi:uncharacterized repeat protein (TIGR01451 family)
MEFAPDGRLFISQKTGALRVVENDVLLPTPFLTIAPANLNTAGERGLLGVAFDPNFATNGYVYVYYTTPNPALHNRVSRFTADPLNPNVALAASETVILEITNLDPARTNHNGGAMHFGPDGKLYIATGENQNGNNAQDLNVMLGKILRINPDGSIPTDNPFYGTATGNNRAIWAYGFRNPYTFAFQPGTGRLFINDVGEAVWEEINDGVAGSNYGWPYREGPDPYTPAVPPAPPYNPIPPGFNPVDPLVAYDHATLGFSCAVTGGAFYNNSVYQYPADYLSDYFYGDYCGGWIQRYDTATATSTPFASGLGFGIVDLKVSPSGLLYMINNTNGNLIRFDYDGAPEIVQHPASITVTEGQTANFSCLGTGGPTLTYQWLRNGNSIPGATSTSYSLPSASIADSGATFRCVVTNGAFGSATSNPAVLTVNAAAPAIGVFDPGLSKVGFLPAGSVGLPGEQITWTTTVTNHGGAAGTNIVVVDTLRPELRIDDASTDRGTVSINGQTVTVTIPNLNPGESVQFRIVTTILTSPLAGVIDNTVHIDGTDVSATATVQVATVLRLPSTGETPQSRDWIIRATALVTLTISLIVLTPFVRRLSR